MVITVILARRLGPESFGLFVFLQWLIDMTFMVFSVGLPGVATRFYPQSTDKNADRLPGFNQWFLRAGLLAALLTCCFATLAALLFSYPGSPASLLAVALLAASSSIWALLGARAQGLFQFKRFAASSAIFVGVTLIGLLLPLVDGDLSGAMLVVAAANLAAATVCATALSGEPIERSQSLARTHSTLIRRYATNSWATSMAASLVWARGEISLVKGHLGDSAVGYYSIGLTLSALVNQGLGLFTGALWPQIARAWDNGDHEELLRFSSHVTNLLMLIAGLAAGFVICFAPYIIALLFGEMFIQSSSLVLILAVGALGLASGCAQAVLQAATNGKFGRDVTIAGGIVLFGVAWILIPHFGNEGAAVARSAIQIGVAVFTLAWLGKVLGHSSGTRQNLRSFVFLVVLAGSLAIWLGNVPEIQPWGLVLVYGVYSSLVFLIFARIVNLDIFSNLRRLAEPDGTAPIPKDDLDLSVLFITYNRSDLLKITYESIRKGVNFGGLSVEFVVADDASDGAHASVVRNLPFDKHVFWPVNSGLGANFNRGLAASSGNYILQIQDDCKFVGIRTLLVTALNIMKTDPEIGIIQLTNQTPDIPYEVRYLKDGTCYWVFDNDQKPYRRDCGERPYSDQPHLKRKQFCVDIGRYAEGMLMSDTENDFQQRVACQAKWRVAYLPQQHSFTHLGAARSFNTSGLRAKRLENLESFPVFGAPARHLRIFLKRVRDSFNTWNE